MILILTKKHLKTMFQIRRSITQEEQDKYNAFIRGTLIENGFECKDWGDYLEFNKMYQCQPFEWSNWYQIYITENKYPYYNQETKIIEFIKFIEFI
jgi:hypothetical protein